MLETLKDGVRSRGRRRGSGRRRGGLTERILCFGNLSCLGLSHHDACIRRLLLVEAPGHVLEFAFREEENDERKKEEKKKKVTWA
jgi:hypothetical protein